MDEEKQEGAPPRGRRAPKTRKSLDFRGTICADHKPKGTNDMEQCTITPPKRQRRKESLIRKDGKADVEQCVRAWNTYRKSHAKPSVREFARLIGEAPSTVRYILNKGTSAKRLAYYLKDKKRWDYYDLSPTLALETSQRRASNKGPSWKVKNPFQADFANAYAETKSVTYALKRLAEKPHDYFIPSRSTVYRLLGKGELQDKDNNPLPYKRYKRPLPKPAPSDHPRNHAPKHMINELSSAARNHLEPGHFQMDTVHSAGGRSGMLTLVDPYCSDPSPPPVSTCVISLVRRGMLGTLQGAVTPAHMAGYLDEFAFRFNRRLSTHRGKLFYRLI